MHLTKHHGLGNDFLITFNNEGPPSNASELAIELCDRRTGLGADGLIFGSEVDGNISMRLFNSDGSAAEISGNGLRCFVQAIMMRRGVASLEIEVDTLAGLRQCEVEATTSIDAVATVDMGSVASGDEPTSTEFLEAVGPVSRWGLGAVGNPHIVFEVDDPTAIDLAEVGPLVESCFPHGVNAHFIRSDGATGIELSVWERGAGITQACGSGATVSAQRAHDWGLVGETVPVHMPGGTVEIDVATSERQTARLRGNATFVGAIEVPARG